MPTYSRYQYLKCQKRVWQVGGLATVDCLTCCRWSTGGRRVECRAFWLSEVSDDSQSSSLVDDAVCVVARVSLWSSRPVHEHCSAMNCFVCSRRELSLFAYQ